MGKNMNPKFIVQIFSCEPASMVHFTPAKKMRITKKLAQLTEFARLLYLIY